jgi:hypothetical protein
MWSCPSCLSQHPVHGRPRPGGSLRCSLGSTSAGFFGKPGQVGPKEATPNHRTCCSGPTVQANLTWNLARVAIEQSSLFLTTPEASRLALACPDLDRFLQNVAAGGGFWNVCQLDRGKFSQELIWLHAVASLKDAAQLAIVAQSLSLGGAATFTDTSEVRSLTHCLQREATYALRVGQVWDTFGKLDAFPGAPRLETISLQ